MWIILYSLQNERDRTNRLSQLCNIVICVICACMPICYLCNSRWVVWAVSYTAAREISLQGDCRLTGQTTIFTANAHEKRSFTHHFHNVSLILINRRHSFGFISGFNAIRIAHDINTTRKCHILSANIKKMTDIRFVQCVLQGWPGRMKPPSQL